MTGPSTYWRKSGPIPPASNPEKAAESGKNAVDVPPSPLAYARSVLNFTPDPVQSELLSTSSPRVILNCARQWGKSTLTAAVALHRAVQTPHSLILCASENLRQSGEFVRKVEVFARQSGLAITGDRYQTHSLRLPNQSRIIALPGRTDAARGSSAPGLVLIDEAARVPDAFYHTIRPTLTHGGHLWLLSTPAGQRGFFHHEWHNSNTPWTRFTVPASHCPRYSEAFLAAERLLMGDSFYRQEYECEFTLTPGAFLNPADIAAAFERGRDEWTFQP
jgi:Terminase large subunit, T4likevirus-type, N-terminal